MDLTLFLEWTVKCLWVFFTFHHVLINSRAKADVFIQTLCSKGTKSRSGAKSSVSGLLLQIEVLAHARVSRAGSAPPSISIFVRVSEAVGAVIQPSRNMFVRVSGAGTAAFPWGGQERDGGPLLLHVHALQDQPGRPHLRNQLLVGISADTEAGSGPHPQQCKQRQLY